MLNPCVIKSLLLKHGMMMNDALYHYNCCADAYLSYFGEFYKKENV